VRKDPSKKKRRKKKKKNKKNKKKKHRNKPEQGKKRTLVFGVERPSNSSVLEGRKKARIFA